MSFQDLVLLPIYIIEAIKLSHQTIFKIFKASKICKTRQKSSFLSPNNPSNDLTTSQLFFTIMESTIFISKTFYVPEKKEEKKLFLLVVQWFFYLRDNFRFHFLYFFPHSEESKNFFFSTLVRFFYVCKYTQKNNRNNKKCQPQKCPSVYNNKKWMVKYAFYTVFCCCNIR